MKDWLKRANEINEEFNNSKYGKLSDGKIRQIDGAIDGAKIRGRKTVEENLGIHSASKEQRSEWGKVGGHVAGKLCMENKIGFFSDEVKKKYRKDWIETKKGMFDIEFQKQKGLRHAAEKKGFHGLSKEETIKNAKRGGIASALVVSKPVLQYTKDGILVKEHKSASDAAEYVGKKRSAGSQIGYCCNGKSKTVFGFVWMWKK
jgi:hypothetical protein